MELASVLAHSKTNEDPPFVPGRGARANIGFSEAGGFSIPSLLQPDKVRYPHRDDNLGADPSPVASSSPCGGLGSIPSWLQRLHPFILGEPSGLGDVSRHHTLRKS
jgi:hypothetical protein